MMSKNRIISCILVITILLGQITFAYAESIDIDDNVLEQWIEGTHNLLGTGFYENSSEQLLSDLKKEVLYSSTVMLCVNNIFSGKRTLRFSFNEETTDIMKKIHSYPVQNTGFSIDGSQITSDRGYIYQTLNAYEDLERYTYVGYVTDEGNSKVNQLETIIYKVSGRTLDEWIEKYNEDMLAGKELAAFLDISVIEFFVLDYEQGEAVNLPEVLDFVYNSDHFFISTRNNFDILAIMEEYLNGSPYKQEEEFGKNISSNGYEMEMAKISYSVLEDSYSAPQIYCTMNVPYDDISLCSDAIFALQSELEEMYPGLWTCFEEVRVSIYNKDNLQQYALYFCTKGDDGVWSVKSIQ